MNLNNCAELNVRLPKLLSDIRLISDCKWRSTANLLSPESLVRFRRRNLSNWQIHISQESEMSIQ